MSVDLQEWPPALKFRHLAIAILGAVMGVILTMILFIVIGAATVKLTGLTNATASSLNALGTMFIYGGAALGVVWLVYKYLDGQWSVVGFRRPQLNWLLAAVPIMLALQFVGGVIASILSKELHVPSNTQACLVQSGYSAAPALAILAIAVVAPVVEETFFRGLLFGSLRAKLGFWLAMPISALLFSLAHIPSVGLLGAITLLPVLFLAGCVLAFLYEKTHSLYPSIVAHMTFNLLGVISILVLNSACH